MTENGPPDWDDIVERHASRVFRVALRIVGAVQDAEDVAQDVFTEAFRLHRSSHVRSWTALLVRLATLRSIDRLHRRRASEELRDDDAVSTAEPFEEAIAKELADRLGESIAELPERQATVFVMHHFEQLSREEISVALGVSAEAVSTALYKARQTLAAKLAAFCPGERK